MKKKIIYIKEVPYENVSWDEQGDTENKQSELDLDTCRTAASGETYEMALDSLLLAINGDFVDTENCKLVIHISEV